jgi:hypothetical protein
MSQPVSCRTSAGARCLAEARLIPGLYEWLA